MTEEQVDAALNSPMTTAEINKAMGFSTPAIPTTTPVTTPIPAAVSSAASSATTALTSIWGVLTGNIENAIFVLLGLLLIAAGIFAFKSTQTIISTGTKFGAKAAEVAAA
jgi:LPXTG-motif cell wall-anchored protein